MHRISATFASYIVRRCNHMSNHISSLHKNSQQFHANNRTSAIELDSHADSPVVGCNAEIIEDSGQIVHVSGFTEKLGRPLTVSVVTAAVMYDCELTGNSYVLVIHNALYIKEMVINLIPPIMMRLSGLEVDECPKFLS